MARTIQEIKAEIIAKKEAESALNGLTSTSSTAIWRVWVDVFAIIINIHDSTSGNLCRMAVFSCRRAW